MDNPRRGVADVRGTDAEAAEWVVRRDRGLSVSEGEAFRRWLSSDPAHRESFARHGRVWGRLDFLGSLAPGEAAPADPELLALPSHRRLVPVTVLWMAAAAALAVAFVVLWPRRTGSGSAVPATPPAVAAQEYGRRVLDDGSIVEVKGAAEVVAAFTPAERRVRLIRGEAHFTVSKNPLRPFIVSAGGVGVRAVGTAFDVALSGAGVSVLVTEGRVQVSREREEGAAPVLIFAGYRTEVLTAPTSPAPVPVPVSAAQIERYLSWKPRLLDFDNAPLSEIVEGFNRGGAVHLVLADAETGRIRMNLIAFNPKDVDTFVRLADRYYGIRAERKGDSITLRRAR